MRRQDGSSTPAPIVLQERCCLSMQPSRAVERHSKQAVANAGSVRAHNLCRLQVQRGRRAAAATTPASRLHSQARCCGKRKCGNSTAIVPRALLRLL